MIKIVRSVFIFVLVTVLASCEYWNKDMLGYLEYWSSTVQMGRVEVTDVTIQKNDSGVDTISASSTPTITGYIINPQSYQLLAEIGDSSNTDKSIRISNPTVQVKAQLEGYDPTMLRIKLNPADSSLEHTDFRVDFEAIRQETMQSSGQVMGVTLRYNTPPIAPTPIIKNDDTGEYSTVTTGQIWKADRGGYVYWAYDDSITDEKDPNCAKWFTVNGTRHLVAECKVPNEQVAGLSIFRFKTDYSNTTLAAVDVEGVSSSTLTSGQAVPPATYVIKYDANGATGGSVPASQNKPQYTDITLARNEGNLTRIGYRFLGWNTSPDGNGQDYAEGATYSDDAGVTLYAKWDVVNTVTFTPGSDTVDHGDSVIIYPPAGATIHYSTDEGVSWENGSQDQPVTITLYNETNVPQGTTGEYVGIPEGGEVTITAYAVHTDGSQSEETSETYSLNQYTVTYDGNGNSYGNIPSPKTFFSGKKVQLASQDNLRRSGYSFGGWNTADNGSGKTYAAGSEHVFTGDTKLYAKWNPMTEFFVSSSSTNAKSNDGSEEYPFGTVDKAVFYINEINDGTQSFIIHVEGTYTATEDDVKNDNTSVVNIAPDKTLTLTIQGKDGQTATINANNHGRVMYVGGKANVTLKNITLTGGSADYGGGVYIDGGTLIMETGSSIKNNTANDQGGGVYIAGGTLKMETDSSINGNTASSQGGGVFINNGEFNMTGGTISGNTVTSGNGGGVFVKDTGSTFTMSDNATISGNAATEGGGVYSTGILNMSGGTISGNTATNDGGGVYNTSSFEMTGGTISSNTASNEGDGGGVYVTGSGTTFTMENGAIISGNTAGTGGGVYNTDNGEFTMKTGATISGNTVKYNGGGVYVTGSGTTFTMENGAISGNTARNGGGGGVYVTGSGTTFTMENGAIISGNKADTGGGGVFLFSGTFTMNSGTISSNTARTSGGGVYNLETFTMNGGTISGNEATGTAASNGGGGVYNTSSFEMTGGTISGNTATNDGGGVYNTSSFEMTGGTISGNTAENTEDRETGWGGGVYNSGTFIMSGSASISNNTASNSISFGGWGGGVYNSGNIEMKGGTISRNIAQRTAGANTGYGGGVYNDGTFTMSDGAIGGDTDADKNTADNGGGVYNTGNGTFTMSDNARISNNEASSEGGGVYNTVTLKSTGGAPIVDRRGIFTMNGGTISGNTATTNGGGVYNDDGTFNHNDGTISGNNPTDIYIYP